MQYFLNWLEVYLIASRGSLLCLRRFLPLVIQPRSPKTRLILCVEEKKAWLGNCLAAKTDIKSQVRKYVQYMML